MIRLFVALELPFDVRERLLGVMGGVPGAKWQDDAQLHLTLRFIGEVEESKLADIHSALSAISFEPFDMSIESTGLFGTIKKPRFLWAGVTPEKPLKQLAKKIEAALVRCGLAPETRKFVPHITLARCKRDATRITRFLERSADLSTASWSVDHFVLYRSHLGHGGAHYEPVAHYPEQHALEDVE